VPFLTLDLWISTPDPDLDLALWKLFQEVHPLTQDSDSKNMLPSVCTDLTSTGNDTSMGHGGRLGDLSGVCLIVRLPRTTSTKMADLIMVFLEKTAKPTHVVWRKSGSGRTNMTWRSVACMSSPLNRDCKTKNSSSQEATMWKPKGGSLRRSKKTLEHHDGIDGVVRITKYLIHFQRCNVTLVCIVTSLLKRVKLSILLFELHVGFSS
jgi:hypothetical protein